MPLYEYECFVCRHRFERIQRFSDPPATECPACGGSVRRLLGVPALQFKGSGFYITDYGKSGGGGGSSRRTERTEPPAAESEPSSSPAKDTSKPGENGGEKKAP